MARRLKLCVLLCFQLGPKYFLPHKESHFYRPILSIHPCVVVSFLEYSFGIGGGAASYHLAVLPNFKFDFSRALLIFCLVCRAESIISRALG